MGFGIVDLQKIKRLVGKHHAEAEGSIGWILFADPDPDRRHRGL
jgi:hypothetical protein